LDFAEKNGYIRGVVREIIHDSGRWVLFNPCVIGGGFVRRDGVDRVENEDLRKRCGVGEVLGGNQWTAGSG